MSLARFSSLIICSLKFTVKRGLGFVVSFAVHYTTTEEWMVIVDEDTDRGDIAVATRTFCGEVKTDSQDIVWGHFSYCIVLKIIR